MNELDSFTGIAVDTVQVIQGFMMRAETPLITWHLSSTTEEKWAQSDVHRAKQLDQTVFTSIQRWPSVQTDCVESLATAICHSVNFPFNRPPLHLHVKHSLLRTAEGDGSKEKHWKWLRSGGSTQRNGNRRKFVHRWHKRFNSAHFTHRMIKAMRESWARVLFFFF